MATISVDRAPDYDQLETAWKRPGNVMPLPSLHFLFHLECDMDTFQHAEPNSKIEKSTVMFRGGRFEGPKLQGEILAGGGGSSTIGTNAIEHTV